ncbi:hypothetical protein GEMRC1_005846 [Eukaryota sp. GEM-RC1]
MSSFQKGSEGSHVTSYSGIRSMSMIHKAEQKTFSLFRTVSSDASRFNFCASLLLLVEILQISGIVLNRHNFPLWDSLFDMTFAHWLTIPVTSSQFNFELWPVYIAIVVIIALSVISLTIFLAFGRDHIENSLKQVFVKGCVHFMCTLCYVPLTSILLSLLFCSPQNDDVSLHFRTLFNESNCWGIQSILLRTSLLLLLVLLFCCVLSYYLCCYDGNPCSKRPFARAHSHVQFWLFLSKSVILLIFYFLPFRPWLFRTVYLFCSLFIPFLVATRLPFYKSSSNLKYVIFLSLWTATSFCYLINLLYVSNHVTQSNQGTVVLATWTFFVVLFSTLFYLICKNSINRYYTRPSSKTPTSVPSSNPPQHSFSIGALSDMDESDTEGSTLELPTHEPLYTITDPSIKLPSIKYVWQIELFTRFLQPKPLRAPLEDKDLAFLIFDHIGDRFSEQVDTLLFKINFEIFVKENHLAVISIKSLINGLDCDLNFRHRFLLHYYQLCADDLRRRTNTGADVTDAKSSIMFQKNLREAKELHKDCLDCLIQFWKTLTSENSRIDKLPVLTDKLRGFKASADNIFKLLLNSFPDNREVLGVYAKYIREVNMDDETAKLIEEAVEIQSSIGSEGTSSRAPSQALSADYSTAMSRASKGGRRKRKKKNRLSLSVGGGDQSHQHVERLSRIMFISFTLVAVVTIISFVFFSNTLNDVSNRAQQLIEGSHISIMSNKIVAEAQLYSHYFEDGEHYKQQILEDSEHIGYHARRVFMGSDSLVKKSSYICPRVNEAPLDQVHDEIIMDFVKKPSLVSLSFRNTNPPVNHAKVLNYWETVLSYSIAAVDFVTSFDGENLSRNNYFRYLIQNRRTIIRGGNAFWSTILEASADFFYITRFISIVSFFIVLGCLIVIGVFGFHRIILSISVERQGVLNLFLWVPKDTCRRIVSDLQSRFKSSGVIHHEDSDDDFDDIASNHSNSDDDDLVEHLEGTTISMIIDDHDHVEQSTVVTPKNKVLLSGLSLSMSVFMSIMFFMFVTYSSNQDELFPIINENFELGIVAGDLIAMDFILTSRTYSFVATGDLFWYQSYWGYVESGRRRALIDNFYFSPRVSPIVKDQLSSTQEFSDILSHYQRISQSLAGQVFNHTEDDVSYVCDYQYDIETEQSNSHDRVEYVGYTNWYTNHTHDSSLSSCEQYSIAKETVSSSRYHNHLDSIVNGLLQTSDLINTNLWYEADRIYNDQRSFFILFIVIIVALLICTYFLVRKFLNLFPSKKVALLGLILIPLFILLVVFISVLFASKFLSDWDVTSTITDDVISHVSKCKFLLAKIRYLSDRFIFSGNVNTYREYRSSRQQLIESIEDLVVLFSKFQNSPLKSSLSKLQDSFTNVYADFDSVFRIQDIALVLACSHYQIPPSLTPELDDIDWDIATEENSHLKIIQHQNIPISQRYTNKTFDLSRSSSDQLLLAQHLTMGRSFLPTLSHALNHYLVNPVNEFVSSSVNFMQTLRNPQLWFVAQILLLVAICFTVVLFLFVVVLISPKKKVATHVKQVVELVLINKFHNHSIVALAIMALGIAVFFIFSIYAMFTLQPWPGQLQLAGERATLVYIISWKSFTRSDGSWYSS